ncbi:MAG: isoleucine--tRNA ligase, partial [Lactobacillales bacterium]|nr:isoleucine--tRNA ligase [Lactobacillales bacterium]
MKMKDTLNLGKTAFPMRGNLPHREVIWQKDWEEKKVYEMRQKINKGKPSFILHDGPPYANGNIHLGHSLNKISKDIIVRAKSMSGFFAPFIPGWDTHGLPIEQMLVSKGVKRKEIPLLAYLEKCKDYALSQVAKQCKDFKRLGVSANWDHPYITLDPHYEAAQIRIFGKMAEKDYIYQGLKPIYWSPSSESSLAEAEIEYKDIKSPSIYVAFKVADGKGLLDQETEFVIWTTTPWTLPANLGISVNPNFTYVVVKVNNRKFVVAKEVLGSIAETVGWAQYEIIQDLKGSEMEYMTANHPFYNRTSLVMISEHVTNEAGTGLVHTAPGFGEDDYIVGKKYGLEILSPVDSKGIFTAEAPGFKGMFYDKANQVITKMLTEKGVLLKLDFFTHSYPHDWRTKKPVIFRATTQWFASIDKFRQNILTEIEKVDWIIPWGKTRLYNMVRDRGDWVISRQRAWGVPLPIFYAENGEAIIKPETVEYVAKLIDQFGAKIWYERSAKDLLPEGFTHPSSPNKTFTKEKDIMDVWFDSGSSHAILKKRSELSFPADMYLEGSDQYRGWFNSSITTSVAISSIAPYKAVLSQGFVLDSQGRKMSKSLGNIIAPAQVMKQYGADILRLWVVSVDAQADVRVSMDILGQIAEVYRKIRNTMRFLLANTSDFHPKTDAISYENLRSVDKYMMVQLNKVIHSIREKGYDKYNFGHIYKTVMNFLTNDLSAFYLDFAKDVVYIEGFDHHDRRAMQTVFYQSLVALTKLLTPILPHTAEEIWTQLPDEEETFVQLAEFPKNINYNDEEELMQEWSAFFAFRNKVLKALEEARNEKKIGKSLEAKVVIYPNKVIRTLLSSLNHDIAQLLIVSEFEIGPKEAPKEAMIFDDVAIIIKKAPGEVCVRCRRIDIIVGK